VPWCADCDRYLSPSTVRDDGTCPTCGRAVDQGEVAAKSPASATTEEALPPIPWHLKLLAVAIAIYLSYRLYQGIQWVLG
jgi:hypothetical protein